MSPLSLPPTVSQVGPQASSAHGFKPVATVPGTASRHDSIQWKKNHVPCVLFLKKSETPRRLPLNPGLELGHLLN